MADYLVVGAGAIGSTVALLLAEDQQSVQLASRRGSGPSHPRIGLVAADAKDSDRVSELATGAAAIFNCISPPYDQWPTQWPPMANALLIAAEKSGAVLVTMSNLYAYGLPTGPMTPESPLLANYEKAKVREKMWLDAMAAHNARRIRATEVRASDFIGPNAQSAMGDRVFPRVLAGKSCTIIGSPDVPHSWTYTLDVARTLIACANTPDAWGRAWHAPTNVPRTQREVVNDIADVAGLKHVKVTPVPTFVVRAMGIFNPLMRELPKTMYQFTSPFIIDDSATRETFGLEPTPWNELLLTTLDSYRVSA
jgi:nucleoside-diphosphate-sugar epimerase